MGVPVRVLLAVGLLLLAAGCASVDDAGTTDAGTTSPTASPASPTGTSTEPVSPATRTQDSADGPTRTPVPTAQMTAAQTPETATSPSTVALTATATTTPAATPSDSSTPTTSATPTVTPTPTATPTATVTPTPTATPTEIVTATPSSEEQTEWTASVVEVVDGDTVRVAFSDGPQTVVRLLGVDTPEVRGSNDPTEFEGIPDTQAGRDWLRQWGHRASEFARAELLDERVRVAVDPTADRRDRYGRLLAYVSRSGTLFNEQLIDRGFARLYDTTFERGDRFADRERAARESEIGIWGFETGEPATTTATTTPTTPSTGGNATALAVVQIHGDAAGNDHENLNDEYLVFGNDGDEPLDLGGWTVSDEADHTYRFPDGVVLDPGDRVTLHTGAGTDSDAVLYWGSGRAVWNNGGDTIVVRDADGTVVLEREYSG